MQCLELGSWGLVAEDANPFLGMLGAKGTKVGALMGRRTSRTKASPGQGRSICTILLGSRVGNISEAGESALEQTHG